MPSWKIVIPLLNRSVVTFRGPVWYFNDRVCFRTITDEDFGALYRDAPDEYQSMVSAESKCVYVDVEETTPDDWTEFAQEQARKVQSVLNFFSAANPIVFCFAVILRKAMKVKVSEIVDLEPVTDRHRFSELRYRLKPSATQRIVSSAYQVISHVCDQYPRRVSITLDRFNSSLARASWPDKIIDITISLESLIGSRDELGFKFALYLSFVVETDPEARQTAFRLLRDLYDARSRLVHGADEKRDRRLIESVINNWDGVSRIAKAAINYYMFYLYSGKDISWSEHLKRLVFGLDTRIVEYAY